MKTVIPEVSKMLGIKIGLDTIGILEQGIGKGLTLIGAHSESARLWRIKNTQWWIYADGFEYRANGPSPRNYIEVLCVGDWNPFPGKRRLVPVVSIPPQRLLFLNRISLGMPKEEVLRVINRKYPNVVVKSDIIYGEAKGYMRISESWSYRTWNFGFEFKRGKLSGIVLSAELEFKQR
jgi:hypothetical protein